MPLPLMSLICSDSDHHHDGMRLRFFLLCLTFLVLSAVTAKSDNITYVLLYFVLGIATGLGCQPLGQCCNQPDHGSMSIYLSA